MPPPPAGETPAGAGEVWWRWLAVDAASVDAGRAVLDAGERKRAAAILDPGTRAQFEAGRGALRLWLGGIVGMDPCRLRFRVGPHGKPDLIPDSARAADWRFNLAHSGGRILIAVARGREVGVDLEPVRPTRTLLRVAERWFSPGEAAELAACGDPDLDPMFFRIWTRKEAWLKARGAGISGGLAAHVVGGGQQPATRVVQDPDGAAWTLVDLPLPGGWTGALAGSGTGWTALHRPADPDVALAPGSPPRRIPSP